MLGTQRAKMQQSKRNASIPKKKNKTEGHTILSFVLFLSQMTECFVIAVTAVHL